jgi:ABC-type spermidine/putrescine transport system permease subunit II
MTHRNRHVTVTVMATVILLLLCAPLIVLFGVALNEGPQQLFPPKGLSLRWFMNIFAREGFINAIAFSVKLALLATAASLVLGILAGLAIVRYRFFGRDFLMTLFMSPSSWHSPRRASTAPSWRCSSCMSCWRCPSRSAWSSPA